MMLLESCPRLASHTIGITVCEELAVCYMDALDVKSSTFWQKNRTLRMTDFLMWIHRWYYIRTKRVKMFAFLKRIIGLFFTSLEGNFLILTIPSLNFK